MRIYRESKVKILISKRSSKGYKKKEIRSFEYQTVEFFIRGVAFEFQMMKS